LALFPDFCFNFFIKVGAGAVYASAELNATTGAKIGSHGAEANLLGFGLAVGKKTAINTPLGSIGFKF
jgi:hypothetical protein